MDRRAFLLTAAAAQRIQGANERVRVGLAGCGGRGRYVANFMRQAENVEFAAACDVYEKNAAAAREWAGGEARAYSDYRKMLEDKSLDAVLVATPDHWHAIIAIAACQAGKHVYVEKPLAHNIREGRAIVECARRSNRIVQAGTQHRSSEHFREAAEIIRSGKLGEVRFVRVWNYVNRYLNSFGNPPDSDPPAGLDWDMYQGPAPAHPYNRARFLATFRSFFDYAGGYITDFGTHRFDTVHQIMNVSAPKSVSATGGRYSLKDAGDTPDVLQATFEYPGFTMSYEGVLLNGHGVGGRSPGMSYYNARGDQDRPNGMAFYGTDGALFADRVGFEIYPEQGRVERIAKNVKDATGLHARNFIDAIRGVAKQNAPVELGHQATAIGHLGNVAFKAGMKLNWDAARETTGDARADRLLGREYRKPWVLPGA